MDTQGVYDEYTNFQDWSTLVGISLLTSSIFIFNIFNDIKEDILTNLEAFMKYGAMAIKNNSEVKAFQRMVRYLKLNFSIDSPKILNTKNLK